LYEVFDMICFSFQPHTHIVVVLISTTICIWINIEVNKMIYNCTQTILFC
jgi:hypothetical protein